MNNVTINIHVQVFVWTYVFNSTEHIPKDGISGSYGKTLCLTFIETAKWFSEADVIFYIPLGMYAGSKFSTSAPILIIVHLFEYNQSSGCEVVSHCGFDVHFPNN